jgi:ADP-ribosyl-[dinitrogen reductase] hydrolase
MVMATKHQRFRGALLGLAAGDALGTTLEFSRPSDPSVPRLTDMVGGGPFGLLAGQWTDDTSMALCLAESLLEKRTFDPVDQLVRYVRWYKEGHLSSNGQCFDIGITVRLALNKFEGSGCTNPYPATTGSMSRAGNGSLMRLCPVVLAYSADPEQAINKAADSSRTTHGSELCIDACRYYAALILGALNGVGKDELLSSEIYSPVPGYFQRCPLAPEIDAIARGEYKAKQPPDIVGSGYVVKSLEAALWAFQSTSTFEEGALKVANLGDDADTTAAIYGQLAGAHYGVESIPQRWRDKLALLPLLNGFADELFLLSSSIASEPSCSITSASAPPSERYTLLREVYNLLEHEWASIQRKLLPGPHMYASTQEFRNDFAALQAHCDAYNPSLPFNTEELKLWFEEIKKALLADFAKRATAEAEKIAIRVQENLLPDDFKQAPPPPPPPSPIATSSGTDGRAALLSAIAHFDVTKLCRRDN